VIGLDVFLVHAAATWALVGLIWTVQLVQYPGFARVGAAELRSFHAHHCARIGWIVAPLMACELLTGLALLWTRPPGISTSMLWGGLSLIGINWAVTAFVAMPLHRRLVRDAPAARSALVAYNWIRTACWSARGSWALFALREVLVRA